MPTHTDFNIRYAERVIADTYGDTVSVDAKLKSLIKFGYSPNIGTSRATIWFTGQDDAHETYVADNTDSIDSISSSSASDTEVVKVEGHTMTGGNRTFVVQTATLNGQTRVALGTALNRVTRVSHNDASSTDLVGEVYVYEDTTISSGKPTDTTKIHLTIQAGDNNSRKASTALSSVDYWIVTGYSAGSLEKSGTNTTAVGGVFKIAARPITFLTGESDMREFNPYLIIPKNSDVRLTALSSAVGQETNGDIQGYLAKIV